MGEIELKKPTLEYKDQVMKYKEDFLKNNQRFDGCCKLEECESYEEWLEFEKRNKKNYLWGYVPSTIYLAVRKKDNKVVGIVDFRHELTPFLLNFGGNVGFSVAIDERKKGYATEIVALVKEEAKKIGLHEILITCDGINEGSSKVILRNGGILEDDVVDEAGLTKSGLIQRYWIEIK